MYNNIERAGLLTAGDHVLFLNNKGQIERKKIITIEEIYKPTETFTITRLDKNTGFFANGLLVAIEELECPLFTCKQK